MDYQALYLSFQGRVNRKTYLLLYVLPFMAIYFVLLMTIPELAMIFNLLAIWPAIVMTTKRLHDRGKSGWWQLLVLIPLVGLIWWLIDVIILPGESGNNQFGPEPPGDAMGVARAA